ncbi:MAG: hypothetical protein RSA78_09030, partial [Oscillospiraceae bacterium]
TISITPVPGDTTTIYTPAFGNSNPAAVSFDGTTVTAIAGGTADITCTINGITKTITITVNTPPAPPTPPTPPPPAP